MQPILQHTPTMPFSLLCLQMRSTRKVSVWPVAFVGGLRYESPKVNAAGKVYGWKTVFDPHRPFAIDMAGFAVNLRLILQRSQAYFKLRGVKGGYQESSLLRELVTLNDLEPKAANCTKVWTICSSYTGCEDLVIGHADGSCPKDSPVQYERQQMDIYLG